MWRYIYCESDKDRGCEGTKNNLVVDASLGAIGVVR